MTTRQPTSQGIQDVPVEEHSVDPIHDLAPFVDQTTILLTTYRRDGTPIGTPVHIAVEGDHAYMRSYNVAWKVKRIRHTPVVTIAPSTIRGKPTGDSIRATARLLDGSEAQHAAEALSYKYPLIHGRLIPFVHKMRGHRTVHFELRPVGDS